MPFFAETPLLNHDVIFWGAITLMATVPSLGYYLYRWRKHELEIDFKREMIARGMSAEDIERVLAAGSSRTDRKQG